MQMEIKIEDSCKEPKVIILTASMTEEVNSIIKKLSEDVPQIITGIKNEKIEVLEQSVQEKFLLSLTTENTLYALGCTR